MHNPKYKHLDRDDELRPSTAAARMLEQRYNKSIYTILLELLPMHTKAAIAAMLGVDASTITRWTERAGLKYRPDGSKWLYYRKNTKIV